MKYAIVEGKKTEALKGGRGICPCCNSELIAKCGDVKINHWAHKGNRNCDHWWENETEWHRKWKGLFPVECQEVVHLDENGEKHIADVRTETGLVIEFQHSFINPEERRSRIGFYQKLIWVVDGLRRIKDKPRFIKVIEEGRTSLLNNLIIFLVEFPEESRIIKEWVNCDVPVFFDFQEPERLWFLSPISTIDMAYIIQINRNYFINSCENGRIEDLVDKVVTIISNYQNYIKQKNQEEINRRVNQIWRDGTRKKYPRRF
ncbi:MAG: hypothetical protein CVT99_02155 [Bacteroidetes bacterium HGW-Bacteroidetes-16]|jgi:hypothetical protein|nr:MAG: hypothetical protein CVT99_02155 [Bacteroidetes bacterium HGW-Bacteroidetes-16]